MGSPIYTINETSTKTNSSTSRSKSFSPRPLSQNKERIIDKLHETPSTQKPRRILLSSLTPFPEILRLKALQNATIQPIAEPVQPRGRILLSSLTPYPEILRLKALRNATIQPIVEPVQPRGRRFLDRTGIDLPASIVPTNVEKEREMIIEKAKMKHDNTYEQKIKLIPTNKLQHIESDREREKKRLQEYEMQQREKYNLVMSRAPQKLKTQPRQSLRYVYTGPAYHRRYTSSNRGPYIPITRVVTQEASSGLEYSNSAHGYYTGSELPRNFNF